MTAEDNHTVPGLEDILSSAVERQISEQQALQDVLGTIRDALEALRDEVARGSAAPPERLLEALEEMREEVRTRIEPAPPHSEELRELRDNLEEVRALVSGAAREISRLPSEPPREDTELAARVERLEQRIAELPGTVVGELGEIVSRPAVPEGLTETLEALRVAVEQRPPVETAGVEGLRRSVENTATDVQALAQAMLDLNAGLREWAQEVEGRVGDLGRTLLEGLRDLAEAQKDALENLGQAVTASTAELRGEVGRVVEESRAIANETVVPLGERLGEVEERLVEAGDLSRYLRDQTEDLDGVISGLGEVPQRLEGVVAQALRRALTIRAGLVREAEKALEAILGPVQDDLGRLVESMGSVSETLDSTRLEEDLRKLGLQQIELTGRFEDLQAALLARLDEVADEATHRDEVLAEALDRAAAGLEPEAARALEGTAKPKTKKKKTTAGKGKSSAKPEKSTRKKAPAKKPAAQKKSSAKKPAAQKKSSARSKRKQTSRSKTSKPKKSGSSGSRRAKSTQGKSRGRTTTRTRNFIPV